MTKQNSYGHKNEQKIGFFRHIIRGCGYLPHCGEHPGTGFLIFLVFMGAAAGAKGGWFGALIGASVMFVAFGSIYLIGAYSRSKTEEQIEKRNREPEEAGAKVSK